MVTFHLPFQQFCHHSNNSFIPTCSPARIPEILFELTHSNLACSLAQNSHHFLMTHSGLACSLAIARLSLHVRTHSDLASSIARHFGHLGMTQQIKLVLYLFIITSCSNSFKSGFFHCSAFWSVEWLIQIELVLQLLIIHLMF